MTYYGLSNSNGRNVVIAYAILGAFSTMTTLLRLLSRRVLGLSYMLDDYLVVGANIVMIIHLGLHVTLIIHSGFGNHVNKVDPEDVKYGLKALIPAQCLYVLSLAMAKTSILSLYMRIFGFERWVRVYIWILAGVIWAWATSTILEAFLLCRPFAFNWDTNIPGGECANRNVAFIVAGVLNMTTDILVIVVPLPNIWKLKLTLLKKIALCMIFCLGLFISAISIIRIIALGQISFKDITYTAIKPVLWSIVEIQLAIVAVNIPLLRPIVARIFFFVRSRTTKKENSGRAVTTVTTKRQGFTRLGDPSPEGYMLQAMEVST